MALESCSHVPSLPYASPTECSKCGKLLVIDMRTGLWNELPGDPAGLDVSSLALYAWVGEDELGSGEIGLKQGVVPAGYIPMVAIDRAKLERYWPQAENQASAYGKRIYLIRFQAVEIVRQTEVGS